MNYKLSVIKEKFLIDTTYMDITMSERKGVVISLDIKNLESNAYESINISFDLVAKVEFTQINFWESNYNKIDIVNCDLNFDPSGFFIVNESKWRTLYKTFDPKKRFQLKHFLITGLDSYLELLANENYSILE